MKKFLSKFSVYHIEILFLLIVGLVPLLWYKAGYIGLGHDMGFPLAPIDHFLDRLYTWTDRLGPFGSNSVQVLPGIFIHGLEALLSFTGFSVLMVQKITYIFWFTLPGITMYILIRYLHPKKDDYSVRISGSLFYMMNHYLLQAWTIAERTKFSIVAALPLVVLLVIKVLHQKESPVKNSLLMALILFFLNGGEGIPLLICLFLVVALTAITFFIFSNERFTHRIKRILIFSFLSALFWTLLSSYWLYPYFKSYKQTFGQRFEDAWGTAGAVSWSQSISANTSWINLFKLRGIPDWYSNIDHPYANEFLKSPLLLTLNDFFIVLALISLLNIKNLSDLLYKTRVYFLGLLLVAVPLSATSHSPLGFFYDYLLTNMPGFDLFRSGFFKFGMIIWFAYAYLIAVGVKDAIDWLKTKLSGKYKTRVPLVLIVGFVISLFIYNYPFFTGNFFNYAKGKSTMIKVPNYVFEAKKKLDMNKFSTRTLHLPNADIRTEYIEYDWKYFSLSELSNITGRKSSIVNGVSARPNEKNLIVSMLSEYIKFGKSSLLKFTGADKAIIENDFLSPDYEGNPLSGIKDAFKKSDDFTYTESVGKWDFYNSNKDTLPQIYSPSKIALVSSTVKNLDLAANLLGYFNEDAFLWSDSQKKISKEEIFDKYLIQANCVDCPPTEIYQIFFSPSKVLIPGTPLYQLGKFVTNFKKRLTNNPNDRLNINLATSTTLISDLGVMQAEKQEKGIKVITDDLIKILEEIRLDLDQTSNSDAKTETLKKIRFFFSLYISYESQWAAVAQPGPIKADLSRLEKELRKFANEIEMGVGQIKNEDNKSYEYNLSIPQDGVYDLYLYHPDLGKATTLNVGSHTYSIQKFDLNWYIAKKIPLKSSSIIRTTKFQGSNEGPIIFTMLDKNINLISPNIEFVALNQTKYLIKVKENENFILNFNSRFDNNWSLREVDYKSANKYFSGDKRSFLSGKIVEYKRGDRHIVTDIIFPNKGQKYWPAFELNDFSNGWFITSQNQVNKEKIYLLEYNLQNDFYKAVGVSLVSLLIILSLYFYKHGN